MSWAGRTLESAIVLGASGGIGAATIARLSECCSRVVAVGRRFDSSIARSDRVEFREWSGMSRAELLRVLGDEERFSLVVNCVGVGFFSPLPGDFEAQWEEMLSTNILGLANVCSILAGRPERFEHFIHISSLAAVRPSRSPGSLMYSVSKSSAVPLLAQFRNELRASGSRIKVTSVTPGFVGETRFGERYFAAQPGAAVDLFARFAPLAPADVAELVAFAALAPSHVEINDLVCRPVEQPD